MFSPKQAIENFQEALAKNQKDKKIFVLDGDSIKNIDEFFVQMDLVLPHETGLSAHKNWDALEDWLWSEIMLMREEGVLTVTLAWKKFSYFERSSGLEDLLLLVQFFCELRMRLEGVNFQLILLAD